jgi:ABC-2 type transport system permease protein
MVEVDTWWPSARIIAFTPIIETLRGLLFGTAIGSSGWIALGWCVLLTFVGYIWGRSLYDRDPQPR